MTNFNGANDLIRTWLKTIIRSLVIVIANRIRDLDVLPSKAGPGVVSRQNCIIMKIGRCPSFVELSKIITAKVILL